jgi:putative drug exporter of the RND superfamily
MLGIGTAVAVLIDATVVRGVLLPAALTLLRPKVLEPVEAPTERVPAYLPR